MTTTSEQQAVPVAQEKDWHRALAVKRYSDPAVQRVSYLLACQLGLLGKGRLTDFHEGQCAISAAESMVEGVRSVDARLTPIEGVAASELPVDVRALVITAREFWDDNNDQSDESTALDKALEAFSSRVPYNDEPTPSPAIPEGTSGEGVCSMCGNAGMNPCCVRCGQTPAALTPDAAQTRQAEVRERITQAILQQSTEGENWRGELFDSVIAALSAGAAKGEAR